LKKGPSFHLATPHSKQGQKELESPGKGLVGVTPLSSHLDRPPEGVIAAHKKREGKILDSP